MNINIIKFNFNLKSDPERDATIVVEYDFYRGNPLDIGDPCECDIIRAYDEEGVQVPIEEIQSKAQEKIWQQYQEEREDQMYESRREI